MPGWLARVLDGVVVALLNLLGPPSTWLDWAERALRRRRARKASIMAHIAQLRDRGSGDAASMVGQAMDLLGDFAGAYQWHSRAAQLYEHPEDRAHAAFDAAVAAAMMGWGRRSGDMLRRAASLDAGLLARRLDVEPAFNLVIDDPEFQAELRNLWVV